MSINGKGDTGNHREIKKETGVKMTIKWDPAWGKNDNQNEPEPRETVSACNILITCMHVLNVQNMLRRVE